MNQSAELPVPPLCAIAEEVNTANRDGKHNSTVAPSNPKPPFLGLFVIVCGQEFKVESLESTLTLKFQLSSRLKHSRLELRNLGIQCRGVERLA